MIRSETQFSSFLKLHLTRKELMTMGIERPPANKNDHALESGGPESRLSWPPFITVNALLLVFLGFGGGLMTLYYSRIHYFPEIEWKSAIMYLAGISFVGGGVAIIFACSVLVPGYIWNSCMVLDPATQATFSYNENEPCVRAIWKWLGWPFLTVMFISHLFLLLIPRWGTRAYAITGILALLLTALIVRFWWFKKIPRERESSTSEDPTEKASRSLLSFFASNWKILRRRDDDMVKRHLFKFTVWFSASILLSQVSLLFVYLMSGRPVEHFWPLTVMCTLGVFTSTLWVAVNYSRYPTRAVVGSLIVAVLLLIAANHYSFLPGQIMDRFGFGESHRVDILVDKDGADLIKGLELEACKENKLCDVEILSKVGDEYFLRTDKCRTFTLPKSVVKARTDHLIASPTPSPCPAN